MGNLVVTTYYETPEGVVVGQMRDESGKLFNFTANPVANYTVKISERSRLYNRKGEELLGVSLPEGEEIKLEEGVYYLTENAGEWPEAIEVNSVGELKRRPIGMEDGPNMTESFMRQLGIQTSAPN